MSTDLTFDGLVSSIEDVHRQLHGADHEILATPLQKSLGGAVPSIVATALPQSSNQLFVFRYRAALPSEAEIKPTLAEVLA